MSLDAAVWATTPSRGSQKILQVIAYRSIRLVSITFKPTFSEILSNVVSCSTGKLLAIL